MDSEKKLSTKEKQSFLNGNDVPENQVTNPWSIICSILISKLKI